MTINEPFDPVILRPGDCCLYRPSGVFGWIIATKTWHRIGHCEGYVGDGISVAARDGIGVGLYPLRTKGLCYVLRPTEPFDLAQATFWFNTVNGQGYDWLGLLRFVTHGRVIPEAKDRRQFCSEFLTRWYRQGGFDPFVRCDADAVAPCDFYQSNDFALIGEF